MAKWKKETLKLKKNHGWRAKPGYKIFVADRGAVRFDIPQDWVMEPGSDSIQFHDRQPPDDDCRLQLSLFRLHPSVNWSALPLKQLLREAVKGNDQDVISWGEIIYERRPDLELAWMEVRWTDTAQGREARSRHCLARGSNVQPFITMDYWPEDAKRVLPVWDEVLRTLVLGDYIADPTRGAVLH